MTSQLLSAYKHGSLELANRVVMAPMTRGRCGANSRLANEIMKIHYEQRASAGLIIVEATAICAQGYGWTGAPALYTAEQAEAWKPVVNAVHAKGGKIFVQAWHMGRQAHSSFHDNKEIVAPSAIKVPGDGHVSYASLHRIFYWAPLDKLSLFFIGAHCKWRAGSIRTASCYDSR
jgi:N-ethylmaleimide reductase